MPGYLETLKSYKCQSPKFIDAPLSKKQLKVSLEEPVQRVLDNLDAKERIGLVRRAIGEYLINHGLLEVPENN
jgi:hypothetical protein